MNRDILEALLARVVDETEPDRELDAEIAVALFGGEIVWKTANWTMESYPARRIQDAAYRGGFANTFVLAYTHSLDAARTLIPSGWQYVIGQRGCGYFATLSLGNTLYAGFVSQEHSVQERALIAACIKALMANDHVCSEPRKISAEDDGIRDEP
jgi:hypothetical protein